MVPTGVFTSIWPLGAILPAMKTKVPCRTEALKLLFLPSLL